MSLAAPALPHWDDGQYFAAFSDIHANAVALEAAFSDLTRILVASGLNAQGAAHKGWSRDLIGVDRSLSIWVLGDTLDAGPCPTEVLDLVDSVADVHIYGNHEQYLQECLTGRNGQRYKLPLWRYVPWTIDQVGSGRLAPWFKKLEHSWVSPDRFVTLVHGTPSHNDRAPAFTRWNADHFFEDEVFEGPCAGLTMSGHTHLSGIYRIDPKTALGGLPLSDQPLGKVPEPASLWVNAGSVGYPFLRKAAEHEFLPYAVYVVGCYSASRGLLHLRLRRLSYPLTHFDEQVSRAGVLHSCAPYAPFIYLQTVLNQSIVFQAFRWVREKGYSEAETAEGLEAYFSLQGLDRRLEEIRRFARHDHGSRC